MVVVHNHVKEISTSFPSSDEVFGVSEFQSCAQLKKDLQVLRSELKSVSEIINIFNEELLNKGDANQGRLPNCVREKHPIVNDINCDNCSQLDNQLKITQMN
jgi:hypothetical protein